MRNITTRQSAIDLAQEELLHLDALKNDPAAVQHFLNTLKAEKMILELINLRYANRG